MIKRSTKRPTSLGLIRLIIHSEVMGINRMHSHNLCAQMLVTFVRLIMIISKQIRRLQSLLILLLLIDQKGRSITVAAQL